MRKASIGAILALLLSTFAFGAVQADKITLAATGATGLFVNDYAAETTTFTEIPSGTVSGVNITIQGCNYGASGVADGSLCASASDTYTGTTQAIRPVTFSNVYDYFWVTGTWTGSGTWTIKLKAAGGIAGGGGSGGAVNSVFGRTGTVTAQSGDYTVSEVTNAVPNTTTVNGHALSANVVVSASDLTTGTLPHAQLPTLLSGDIPNNAANTTGSAASLTNGPTFGSSTGTLNIANSKTLTFSNTLTLAGTDGSTLNIGAGGTLGTGAFATIANYVPTSTTVNGHALSANVTVSASDLTTGTLPHAQLPALVSGDIPNNAANTTGTSTTATNLSSYPTLCSGGQYSQGLSSGSNNCGTPSGSGTTNAASQYSEPDYSAAGSATTLSGIAPPALNGTWMSVWSVTASAAVQKTVTQSGVPVDATNPSTLLYSDRASYLNWTSGTALALPAVTTCDTSHNFGCNLPFVLQNTEGATLTVTPNAGASDLIDGASTGTLLNKFAAFVYQDSTTAPGHWFTVKFPTFGAFGSTCTGVLQWSTTTGFSCNTSPTLTGTNISAIPLANLATQAADTVTMNATSGSAAPTAVSLDSLGGTNSCAGTTNALTWNSSTHAWGCNTISGGSATLPTTNAYFLDDFNCANSGGNAGCLQWTGGGSTPTLTTYTGSGTGNYFGAMDCATVITATNYCSITQSHFSFPDYATFTGGSIIVRTRINATTNDNFFAGVWNVNSGYGETAGGYAGVAYSVSASDTGWMCVVYDGSTKVRTAVSGTLDTNFHTFTITWTAAKTIQCQVDGGTATSMASTHYPTDANETPGVSIDNNGTANIEHFTIDYYYHNLTGLSR